MYIRQYASIKLETSPGGGERGGGAGAHHPGRAGGYDRTGVGDITGGVTVGAL